MAQSRRSGSGTLSSGERGPHSCGTAPGSHRTSLLLRHRRTGRRSNGTSGTATPAPPGRPRRPRRSGARSPASRTPRAPARGPAAPIRAARSGSASSSVIRAARPARERVGVVRVVGHQQPGAAVVDHLGDAADGTGDDGGAAGRGLQVHDAQRLVDRGDDEDGRAGDQRHQLLARHHRLDPHHAPRAGPAARRRRRRPAGARRGCRRRRRTAPGRRRAAAARPRPAGAPAPSAG